MRLSQTHPATCRNARPRTNNDNSSNSNNNNASEQATREPQQPCPTSPSSHPLPTYARTYLPTYLTHCLVACPRRLSEHAALELAGLRHGSVQPWKLGGGRLKHLCVHTCIPRMRQEQGENLPDTLHGTISAIPVKRSDE